MNDSPSLGHNNPPIPTLAESLAPATVEALIAAELDREPLSAEGGNLPSIRTRDPALMDSCRRFLKQHPSITGEEAKELAGSMLKACSRFTGRIETVRAAMKRPVIDAGKAIDTAFGKYGAQLEIRPLTGPMAQRRRAPFTLAEQIAQALADYDDRIYKERVRLAQEEADRKAEEARVTEELARKGSGTVTFEDAASAYESAAASQAIADAKPADLTRTITEHATTSLVYKRVVTIVTPADVPRQYCEPVYGLIVAASGKAGTPIPTIAGVTIEDVPDNTRR
jgi:hypothetical protein